MPLRSMAWVMAPISRNFQLSPFWAARYSREESLAPGFSYRGNTESPWAAQISSLRARRVCKVLGDCRSFKPVSQLTEFTTKWECRCPASVSGHQHLEARPSFWANSKAMAWAFSNVTASFGEKDCTYW